MSLINTQIQPVEANTYHNGEFIKVSDNSLKGQWSVLIFMPAAFTFNCPTEIEDAADHYAEFKKAGMKIRTDHWPFRLASETLMNSPLWYALASNGWIWVLMRDIIFPLGEGERVNRQELGYPFAGDKNNALIASI
jgi:AhpC/TSA family